MPELSVSENQSTAAGNSSVCPDLDLQHLIPGEIWRKRYAIRAQLPDITHGKVLSAYDQISSRDVQIRSFRVVDSRRSQTWDALAKCPSPVWVEQIEALEHDGRRCEITYHPAGESFRAFGNGKKMELAHVRELTASISSVISKLHSTGVAHLNLNPDVLYLRERSKGDFVIGGLEAANLTLVAGLVPINHDPFYAPPEAAGLYQHHSGHAMFAWDWWSVGRIIQELVLGQHAFGIVFGRDVSRRTPELLSRADSYMREKGDVKVGAVESMPDLNPEIALLLRGLLSGCRDARWGAKQVNAWLKGDAVIERYHLSRDEQLFHWRGDAYTASEAADKLRFEAAPIEAQRQAFNDEQSDTLRRFLGLEAKYRSLCDKIADIAKLRDSNGLQVVDAGIVQEVVTSLTLSYVVGPGQGLVLRGERVSLNFLRKLLNGSDQGKAVQLAEALIDPGVLSHFAVLDLDASAGVSDFAAKVDSALTIGAAQGILPQQDVTQRITLFRFCADAASASDRLNSGHQKYAVSRNAELNTLFQKPNPTSAEVAVLAATLSFPDDYKYVTHDVWLLELYAELKARGETLAKAATWLNLDRMLRHGILLFAKWPIFLGLILVAGSLTAIAHPSRPSLAVAVGVVVIGTALRIGTSSVIRRILVGRIGAHPAVYGIPTSKICRSEAATLIGDNSPRNRADVQREFEEVNQRIRSLPPHADRALVSDPVTFNTLRVSGLIFGAALLTTIIMFGAHVVRNPPTWLDLKTAWFPPPSADVVLETAKDGKANEKNEPRSDDNRVVVLEKIAWPYKLPDYASAARIRSTAELSEEQIGSVEEAATYLLRGYNPETITGVIAVRVSNSSDFSYALFDGRSGKLADKRLFQLPFQPMARSWLAFDGKTAIFLN